MLCFISYQLIVRFLFLLILNHISGMFLLKQEHEVPHRYSLPTKALQLDHYYFQSFKLSSFRLSCHRDAHRFGQLSSKNWPQPWPLTISMTMTIDHVHDHDNEHDQCSWPGASTWESGVQTRRGKMQENHLQHVASVDFSSDHFIIYTNMNINN